MYRHLFNLRDYCYLFRPRQSHVQKSTRPLPIRQPQIQRILIELLHHRNITLPGEAEESIRIPRKYYTGRVHRSGNSVVPLPPILRSSSPKTRQPRDFLFTLSTHIAQLLPTQPSTVPYHLKMSSPTTTTTANNYLILLPTTHHSFDASSSLSPTTSAITEAISAALPTAEQKTRRSSSTASAESGTSAISPGLGPATVADVEPAAMGTSFGQSGFLKLGN